MSTQPKALLTPEQYLEIERKAEFKSEYYKGEMFATLGASLAHNRIASRLIQTLGVQLRGRDCEPLSGDMRVFIPATGLYTYPERGRGLRPTQTPGAVVRYLVEPHCSG